MDKERFLKDIGNRLKELRGSRTQDSISKELDTILGEERTKEAYQHYEAGRRLLPSDVLWGLSRIYNVSADWILRGKETPAGKKPDILSRFHKESLSMAELFQALSKEQREAVKIIVKSMCK